MARAGGGEGEGGAEAEALSSSGWTGPRWLPPRTQKAMETAEDKRQKRLRERATGVAASYSLCSTA